MVGVEGTPEEEGGERSTPAVGRGLGRRTGGGRVEDRIPGRVGSRVAPATEVHRDALLDRGCGEGVDAMEDARRKSCPVE